MANAVRGEVPFVLDEKPYVLSLSINALCELEAHTGSPATVLFATMGDPAKARFTTSRAIFWAALQDRHKGTSIEQAGEMMQALGIPEALVLLGKVIQLAFPDAEGSSGPLADQTASPPAGTGKPS